MVSVSVRVVYWTALKVGHGEQKRASKSIVLICWYYEIRVCTGKLNVNTFFECMSTSTVDINRQPILVCMNRPGWSISSDFMLPCIELTIDIDRNSPWVESNRPSILTVCSRKRNRTDRWYRPWLTNRSAKNDQPNRRHLCCSCNLTNWIKIPLPLSFTWLSSVLVLKTRDCLEY